MKKKFTQMKTGEFDLFFNILKKSLPKEEMRDYIGQKMLLNKINYNPLVFRENDKVLAIMATWNFEDFIFLEHLAIDERLRGKGLGQILLNKYLNNCEKKVFLEVEPPDCEVSKKRIRFYEKLNFKLNDFNYLQPPLNPSDDPLELKIMSFNTKIEEKGFEKYKNIIYKEVYNNDLMGGPHEIG